MPEGGITTASTVVAAILSLADNMSPKLLECGRNWDKLSKAEQRAAKSSMSTLHSWSKQFDKVTSKALKWGAVTAVAAAGAAIKTGFAEAFDLESYRMQLETATKDTERAAKVMTYAVKMAGATPYESGELVAASSALEMAGLKAETYLTTLGDVAAGANKTIADVQTQFVKAFSTGYSADFFRSINVSAKSFEDFARSNKLATGTLADTQIALKKFLDEKFGGGMEKLSHTVKGAWASITDQMKITMTRVVGMSEDGTIRTGSVLDKFKIKLTGIAAQLDKWAENGTLEKWAKDLGNAFEKAWEFGEKIGKFLADNKWTIIAVGGLLLIGKTITGLISGTAKLIANIKTINTAWGALGKTFTGGFAKHAAGAAGAAATGAEATAAHVAATGSAGTQVGWLYSLGLAGALGKTQDKIVDEGVARMWEKFRSRKTKGAQKEKKLSLSPIQSESSYIDTYRDNEFRKAMNASEKKGALNNVFNITINGAEKSDDELAALVAKRILESTENS